MDDIRPNAKVLKALELVLDKKEAWFAACMCDLLIEKQAEYGHKGWEAIEEAIYKLSKKVLKQEKEIKKLKGE